jgi:hypothetical protein
LEASIRKKSAPSSKQPGNPIIRDKRDYVKGNQAGLHQWQRIQQVASCLRIAAFQYQHCGMTVSGEVNLTHCSGLLQFPDAPGFSLEVGLEIGCGETGELIFKGKDFHFRLPIPINLVFTSTMLHFRR